MHSFITRRQWLASLAAATAVPGARAEARPAQDELWTDARRRRELPLRLRFPAGPGPWPWVLYSHGLGGSREGGDVWGRAWAAAGFMVIHVQHPGSDSEVLHHGARGLMGAANAQQLVARAADMQFVLGQALLRAQEGGGSWQGLRADAVGVAGHSFGAQTVQALAGMRYPLPAPGLADPRPRAFIAFSPGLAAGRMSAAEQMGAITRPFLCITGTEDGDPLGRHQDPDFRRAAYDGLPAGAKAELCLDQADHMTFAGNAERRINGRGPFARRPEVAALEDRHHALVAAITTLWWRARLLGDAQAAEQLRSPAGLGPQDRWRSA